MNAAYIILFNLYLGCWLGLYVLVFSKNTFFRMNRFMLLGGIFVAATAPFLHAIHQVHYPMAAIPGKLTQVVVTGMQPPAGLSAAASGVASFSTLVVWIYWAGVAFMSLMFVQKLVRLYTVFRTHPRKVYPDHVHVIMGNGRQVFSFGRYLFAPGEIPEAICRHELIHIRQRHTADNLLLEMIRIFCWFNPLAYLYQHIARTVHEYIADALTVKHVDKNEYAHLLVGNVFYPHSAVIAHHFFNHSLLQKRLTMLQKKSVSRKAGWKYLLAGPFLAVLVFVAASAFTLNDRVGEAVAVWGISDRNQPLDVHGVVVDQEGNPISRVTVMQVGSAQGTITDAEGHFALKHFPANGMLRFSMIGYTTITLTVDKQEAVRVRMYEEPKQIAPIVVVGYVDSAGTLPAKKQPGHVFTFVEQMPQFPGGEAALIKFLRNNIRYPQAARKRRLQGNVLVRFIVDGSGAISHVQTVNDTVGGGLEQEAIRVVEAMPAWKPGRQNGEKVAVQYTLPVRFVLQ